MSRHPAATAVAAALVLLGITACGDDGDDVTTKPNVTATAAPDTSSPPAAPTSPTPSASSTQPAGVGDTITLTSMDGSEIAATLKAVADPATSADEFTEPQQGKRFMAVQLELVNTGKKAYSDSPSNGAQVADSKGQRFDSTFLETTAGPEMVSDMNLTPGSKALGWIPFEVPKTSKITQFQFALDSGFADQTGQWDVTG